MVQRFGTPGQPRFVYRGQGRKAYPPNQIPHVLGAYQQAASGVLPTQANMAQRTLRTTIRTFSNTAPRTPVTSPTTIITNTESRNAWLAYRAAETLRLSSFRLEELYARQRENLPTMLQYTAFNAAALRTFKEDRDMHIAVGEAAAVGAILDMQKEMGSSNEILEGQWVKAWIRSTNGSMWRGRGV
jgi:hypothetical protein